MVGRSSLGERAVKHDSMFTVCDLVWGLLQSMLEHAAEVTTINLKAAINARSHPRSLSQCDREEHDDDDRHDLEGPTTAGCVAADNRKSMRLLFTRLPYMIDGPCLSNDKS